jgi:hypothetical protein
MLFASPYSSRISVFFFILFHLGILLILRLIFLQLLPRSSYCSPPQLLANERSPHGTARHNRSTQYVVDLHRSQPHLLHVVGVQRDRCSDDTDMSLEVGRGEGASLSPCAETIGEEGLDCLGYVLTRHTTDVTAGGCDIGVRYNAGGAIGIRARRRRWYFEPNMFELERLLVRGMKLEAL